MTLWFSKRPRIVCFRPREGLTEKNGVPRTLSARSQQNSEIFTEKVAAFSPSKASKRRKKLRKTGDATRIRTENSLFLRKKRRFSSAKHTFFLHETYNLTRENIQSSAEKHTFSCPKGYFGALSALQFYFFRKAFRQQKHWLADILQAAPRPLLTTRTTASSQPAATRSSLLSINNPNTNPRMKKKEKLKPYMIPTYETILYFCSAFGKQAQTDYQERYINTYLLNL